ncbi:MAG: phosphomethylpyrimidine synthase ThiC, partial [Acetobacteraceae bacterium]|nr:phosphomethylpyrimidine synthase ThiC [Acetobacteraceae bacterium]
MTVQKKPSTVTTGPIAGSSKVFSSPDGRPDMAVPFREIPLDPSAREAPFRVYDTSGPYTDPSVTIDVEAGLPPLRREWIARRGFVPAAARSVRREDNGGAAGDRLVPECPADRAVLAGRAGQPVTQIEFARAGIITDEMIYVAHREN